MSSLEPSLPRDCHRPSYKTMLEEMRKRLLLEKHRALRAERTLNELRKMAPLMVAGAEGRTCR